MAGSNGSASSSRKVGMGAAKSSAAAWLAMEIYERRLAEWIAAATTRRATDVDDDNRRRGWALF